MSNNSVRLDISRGCLISVVGGEKLMIEGGIICMDPKHLMVDTVIDQLETSVSLAVFLLRRFCWWFTWLSEYNKAWSNTSGNKVNWLTMSFLAQNLGGDF
jgi:hypothetical protein